MNANAAVTLAPMPHFDALPLDNELSHDTIDAMPEVKLLMALMLKPFGTLRVRVFVPVSRPAMEYSTF